MNLSYNIQLAKEKDSNATCQKCKHICPETYYNCYISDCDY